MLLTTLDNGLKVILVEDHSAPVVALNVWVHAGSADERLDQWGMAHVHEHMLFKGTEKHGVGEIAATVEGAGGNINAFTSYDMTVYHITMASRDAAVGVDVLADAMLHSSFDATELAKEEEVVIEEIKRSDDSPDSVISKAIFETAYQTHPYHREVIGTQESVRSFTREGLIEFYRHWYVPNNMAFVAVGDFSAPVMLEQVKKAFAGAEPRSDLAHPRASEPPQTAARAVVVPSEFEQSLLGVAWKGTAFKDSDTAYLDLLAIVLGGGDSSRLYREVKDRQQPSSSCTASTRARTRRSIPVSSSSTPSSTRARSTPRSWRSAIRCGGCATSARWRPSSSARARTSSPARCTSARRCRGRRRSTATSSC
jgi:zinc protease